MVLVFQLNTMIVFKINKFNEPIMIIEFKFNIPISDLFKEVVYYT